MDPSLNVPIQALIAWATVHAIELLKNAKWFPWLQRDWTWILRLVGAAASIGTAMGVTMHLTGSWETGGTVTISYPSVRALLLSFYGWLVQQVYYHGVIKSKTARPS